MSFTLERFIQACTSAIESTECKTTHQTIDSIRKRVCVCISPYAMIEELSHKVNTRIDTLGVLGYKLLHDAGYDLSIPRSGNSPGIIRLVRTFTEEDEIIQVFSLVERFHSKHSLFIAFRYAVLGGMFKVADYIHARHMFNTQELRKERRLDTLKNRCLQDNVYRSANATTVLSGDRVEKRHGTILSEFIVSPSVTYHGVRYILDKGYAIESIDFTRIALQLQTYHSDEYLSGVLQCILDLMLERADLEKIMVIVKYDMEAYEGEIPSEYRLTVLLRLMQGGARVVVEDTPPLIRAILSRIQRLKCMLRIERMPYDLVRLLGTYI